MSSQEKADGNQMPSSNSGKERSSPNEEKDGDVIANAKTDSGDSTKGSGTKVLAVAPVAKESGADTEAASKDPANNISESSAPMRMEISSLQTVNNSPCMAHSNSSSSKETTSNASTSNAAVPITSSSAKVLASVDDSPPLPPPPPSPPPPPPPPLIVENPQQNQINILNQNAPHLLPEPPAELNLDSLFVLLRQLITDFSVEDARVRALPEWQAPQIRDQRPVEPLNALVSHAFISVLWRNAIRRALELYWHRETLKLFTGPYSLLAYRTLLRRHHRMLEGLDDRFTLAADVARNPPPPGANDFDSTWLQNTDHIIMSQFQDISVLNLCYTLRFLFGGDTVRHLVIGNYDLESVTPFLSHFTALQSLTFVELPADSHRQRTMFAWLAHPDSLPTLQELHVIEEKEGIFQPLDPAMVAPLFRRLTFLSLVGYPEKKNLAQVLATLNPAVIRFVYLGKLKGGFFGGVVRLWQQLLNMHYGLAFKANAEWIKVKAKIERQLNLLPPPEPLRAPVNAEEGNQDPPAPNSHPPNQIPRLLTALRYENSLEAALYCYGTSNRAKIAASRLYRMVRGNMAAVRATFVRPEKVEESEDDDDSDDEDQEGGGGNGLGGNLRPAANPPSPEANPRMLQQRLRRLQLFAASYRTEGQLFVTNLMHQIEQELLTGAINARDTKVIWALSVPEAVNRLGFNRVAKDIKRVKPIWSRKREAGGRLVRRGGGEDLAGDLNRNAAENSDAFASSDEDSVAGGDRRLTANERHALRTLLKWIARTARRVTRQVALGHRQVAPIEETIDRMDQANRDVENIGRHVFLEEFAENAWMGRADQLLARQAILARNPNHRFPDEENELHRHQRLIREMERQEVALAIERGRARAREGGDDDEEEDEEDPDERVEGLIRRRAAALFRQFPPRGRGRGRRGGRGRRMRAALG